MHIIKYRSILIIFLLIYNSCNEKSAISENKLLKALKEIHGDEVERQKVFLIIPNVGCPGCISSTESFMVLNSQNDRGLKFILTNFKSFKQLKLKIGSETLNSNNIFLDHDNIMGKYNINSIYPIVVFFKNDGIYDIEFVNPENELIFSKILKSLE